jgi:hypothetical protein
VPTKSLLVAASAAALTIAVSVSTAAPTRYSACRSTSDGSTLYAEEIAIKGYDTDCGSVRRGPHQWLLYEVDRGIGRSGPDLYSCARRSVGSGLIRYRCSSYPMGHCEVGDTSQYCKHHAEKIYLRFLLDSSARD